MPRPTIYGIPNCEQIKKTLAWCAEHRLAVDFHDYKKHGVTRDLLTTWARKVDWSVLVNRKGTTWRKLTPAAQARITDADAAIRAMLEQPSLIKRPVVVVGARVHVGYDPAALEQLFASK